MPPYRVQQYPARRPQNICEWTYILLKRPVSLVWTAASHILQNICEWTYILLKRPVSLVWTAASHILHFLFAIFTSSTQRLITDRTGGVAHFISSFESKFGRHHPAFYQGTYSQALTTAKQELKFLLVYLHKEGHHNTDYFCREILCKERFVGFVNSRMIVWACSTDGPEGQCVSRALGQMNHPFLAVIVLRENQMSVVARFEGHVPGVLELMAQLEQVMARSQSSLIAARAQRAEAAFNQFLRQQQDEAYLQSLSADRQKEKKRQEESLRQITEAARKQQEREERQKEKTYMAGQLPREPAPEHPDCIRVLLKLPSGQRIERRFLRSQSIKWLYFYVFCHKDCPDDFQIVTNFPRRSLPCQPVPGHTDPPSFRELGLGTSVFLFVHDNQA
ncbi:hypothetical protein BsWGS_14473 [Bradybaena similaris]